MNGCLTCHHAGFIEPYDWEPPYKDAEFDVFAAAKIIRETKRHTKINCTLNPVWKEFTSNHYCGQWKATSTGLYGISTDVEEFIWGDRRDREISALREENKTLKRQLKKSREISAKRLERLNNPEK